MTIRNRKLTTKLLGSALLLTAALSLPAEISADPAQRFGRTPYDRNNRGAAFYLDGTLIDRRQGGCQIVRDHQGRVYTIVGPGSRGLQVGEHVRLWGKMDGSTVCGTAFKADYVDQVYRDGSHSRVVYDRRHDGSFDPYAYRDNRGRWDDNRGRWNDGRDLYYDGNDNRRIVSLEGRLNEERRACPVLRTDEGDLYNLTGDLRQFDHGDKVRVIGFLDGRSRCGGPAVEVREINGR